MQVSEVLQTTSTDHFSWEQLETLNGDDNNNIYHEISYMTLKSAIQKQGDLASKRTFHFKECIPSEHDQRNRNAKKMRSTVTSN